MRSPRWKMWATFKKGMRVCRFNSYNHRVMWARWFKAVRVRSPLLFSFGFLGHSRPPKGGRLSQKPIKIKVF